MLLFHSLIFDIEVFLSVLQSFVDFLGFSSQPSECVSMAQSSCLLCGGFQKVGGYDALRQRYMEAIPASRPSNTSTCGVPPADAFHIFHSPLSDDNPWPGLMLQSSLGCMWYWCCDQVSAPCQRSRLAQVQDEINL